MTPFTAGTVRKYKWLSAKKNLWCRTGRRRVHYKLPKKEPEWLRTHRLATINAFIKKFVRTSYNQTTIYNIENPKLFFHIETDRNTFVFLCS